MPSTGLQPIDIGETSFGQFLTFIVPGGCNLACPFCLVGQRKEISDTELTPDDFVLFLRQAAAQARIFAVSLQGYEPLLPAARVYTQAVLSTSHWLGLPTGLVTKRHSPSRRYDLAEGGRTDQDCCLRRLSRRSDP